jgi:fatty acid desaturase
MTPDRYTERLGTSRRFRRWRNLDTWLLAAVVVGVLILAPGHGVIGWVVALVLAGIAGGVIGIVGRRYPWIHLKRRRRKREL